MRLYRALVVAAAVLMIAVSVPLAAQPSGVPMDAQVSAAGETVVATTTTSFDSSFDLMDTTTHLYTDEHLAVFSGFADTLIVDHQSELTNPDDYDVTVVRYIAGVPYLVDRIEGDVPKPAYHLSNLTVEPIPPTRDEEENCIGYTWWEAFDVFMDPTATEQLAYDSYVKVISQEFVSGDPGDQRSFDHPLPLKIGSDGDPWTFSRQTDHWSVKYELWSAANGSERIIESSPIILLEDSLGEC